MIKGHSGYFHFKRFLKCYYKKENKITRNFTGEKVASKSDIEKRHQNATLYLSIQSEFRALTIKTTDDSIIQNMPNMALNKC